MPSERAAKPERATPAERNAEKPGAREDGRANRAGERNGTPAERAGERGAPGVPPAGGPAARAPNAASPGAPQQGRFNDPSTPQGGGFHNGDNSRGNAFTGHGPANGFNNGRPGAPAPNGAPPNTVAPNTVAPNNGNAGPGNGGPGNPGPGNGGPGGNFGNRGPNERGQNNGYNNGGNYNNGGGYNNGGYDNRGERRGGISPGGAAAIGAAAGFAGGFLAGTAANNLDGIRRDRREVYEDGRTYIREPGRTIVDEGGGRSFIVHDENARFRDLGYDVRRERRGDDFVDTIDRPGGEKILTYTTQDGRMLRRIRRYGDGREVVLIDNSYDGGIRNYSEDVVDLPPPRYDLPEDRYYVDYGRADEGAIYDALIAPPVAPPPRRYTLDQIRYSPDIRRYVRSVDINTINFASGSWIVPASATGKLRALGQAISRAVQKNPNSVFLVEGYTDATGNPNDNLSLSDRRAQSVAAILSKDFGVPPENLTTQGYGQQNLKVNTQGPSADNRRVVVQNITQLMADNGGNGAAPPR